LAIADQTAKVFDWALRFLQDLFPDKATVNFGAKFTIEYYGTYKILKNSQVSPPKTYLLYQRGCAAPTGVVSSEVSTARILRQFILNGMIFMYADCRSDGPSTGFPSGRELIDILKMGRNNWRARHHSWHERPVYNQPLSEQAILEQADTGLQYGVVQSEPAVVLVGEHGTVVFSYKSFNLAPRS
jgi:hypothetical protein